ncbi:MAG: porin family protein [Christiangramia sp.]|nr:porin family protein [Christiangramia sp.]
MKISKLSYSISILLIAFFIQSASSQSNFGIKAGATAYGFHKQSSANTDEIGFSFGATYQKNITENVHFRPELLLTRKGGWVRLDFGTVVPEDLYYVEAPLLLNWEFINNFSLQAGPQLGILIAEKSRDESFSELGANTFNADASGGFLWELSNRINLNARYSYGLTKVFENFEYYNSAISLALEYEL